MWLLTNTCNLDQNQILTYSSWAICCWSRGPWCRYLLRSQVPNFTNSATASLSRHQSDIWISISASLSSDKHLTLFPPDVNLFWYQARLQRRKRALWDKNLRIFTSNRLHSQMGVNFGWITKTSWVELVGQRGKYILTWMKTYKCIDLMPNPNKLVTHLTGHY